MTPTTNPTPQDKGGEGRIASVREHCDEIERNGFDPLQILPKAEGAEILAKAWRAQNDCLIVLEEFDTLTEETARLKERVRVLEERLEPFARMASDIHEAAPDSALCVVATLNGGIMSNKNFCTVGDLRRARSALHTTPEVGE